METEVLELRHAANGALGYWLYGSICELRSVLTERVSLNGSHLREAEQILKSSDQSTDGSRVGPQAYANRLARIFRILDDQAISCNNRKRVFLGGDYSEWSSVTEEEEKYQPVHEIQSIAAQYTSDLFTTAFIHGSVATREDVEGFSDLDSAFIIRADALRSANDLSKLRNVARELLSWTYAFDPFMHHGPHYITEYDLRHYNQYDKLPFSIFPYSVRLSGNSSFCVFSDSKNNVSSSLRVFEDFFWERRREVCRVCDTHQLEWVIGSVLLLPVLFLQGKSGFFRFKGDAIPLARTYFSSEEWSPIERASRIRRSLGARPKPPHEVVRFCSQWGTPGLLRSWIYHPRSIARARSVSSLLDDSFFDDVLDLIATMKAKLSSD